MAKKNEIKEIKDINETGSLEVFDRISDLIEQARKRVATTINEEMVILYWNIGKTIKEEIMKSDRAEYGSKIVESLSSQLTQRYGKGFSSQNLWYMIHLYNEYPILQSMLGEFKGLSWTHIINLLPIKDELKRKFYAILCQKEHWSTSSSQKNYIRQYYSHN